MIDPNAVYIHLGLGETAEASEPVTRKLLSQQTQIANLSSALRRLHAAAKIVTAYEWPQDVSAMGAMDEFDAAMAEAEKALKDGGQL